MHYLYLGTGKHAFKVWVGAGFLSESVLSTMDRRVQQFIVPEDCQIAYPQTMEGLKPTSGVPESCYTL